MLTEEEKRDILTNFPNIKLSYEKIIHKKVYPLKDNYLLVIPEGKKCFAWFTIFRDKSVCFILELDNKMNKEIKNIKIVNCCFSSSLSYGTLFYGTLFYHMNNQFFSIEDIFSYKGKDLSNINFNDKLNNIIDILKNDINQVSYNNHFVVFGLPIISQIYEDFEKNLNDIKYKINSIIYINKYNTKLLLPINEYYKLRENDKIEKTEKTENNITIKQPKKIELYKGSQKNNNIKQEKILICKPDIQNDIYHLYSITNDFIGLACIPDYKTSMMMNKIFRIIKENDDLDKLEESDDEEEFESSSIDKFVHLDKSFKFLCNYNNKFKKWTPIKII
jgi:hypothetical protein